jgi:hypothetical protein
MSDETRWRAEGPDEFGDFHLAEEGEQLAKCVVVQNGFRSHEETKRIAEDVIRAVNSHADLVAALEDLLALPVAKKELEYLDKGIGAATAQAAWLRARAALAKAKGGSQS